MTAGYLIVVYVLVPVIVLLLLSVLACVCCSKRYRLNWFQRSLLEEQGTKDAQDTERCRINKEGSKKSRVSFAGDTFCEGLQDKAVGRSSWLKYEPLAGGTAVVTPVGSLVTVNISPMGSKPSTPTSQSEDSNCSQNEQFWVPPQVVQKKRAQSLIPQLLRPGDSDEGSPSKTPTSSTSLQEMAFNFPPPERLTETVSMVQVPTVAQRQRRRASMQDALDHTKINASLYQRALPAEQSFGSIQEEHLGAINLSLDYNKEQALLTVRLIQAQDLTPRDFTGTADPYCRICLLPDRRTQVQTKVHKKTLCPEFEEEFIFELPPSKVPCAVLEILLYDYDQFSRDECIGQVMVDLNEVDLNDKIILWKGICHKEKREDEGEDYGDLMFSLGYLSTAERLTVVVLKARHLKAVDEKGASSPFVKVSVIYGGKRLKKKKTSTKRNTCNPVWNEALVFNLANEFLHHVQLEFIVYNDNLISNNEVLGKTVLGPETSGEELAHWKDMLNSKTAMARWHTLVCDT